MNLLLSESVVLRWIRFTASEIDKWIIRDHYLYCHFSTTACCSIQSLNWRYCYLCLLWGLSFTQQEQCKCILVEMRIEEEKSPRKSQMIKKKRKNKCQMFKQNLSMPHPFKEIVQEQLIHMKMWHIIPPRSIEIWDLLKNCWAWGISMLIMLNVLEKTGI